MDEVDISEILVAIAANLQGIRAELRAMRLENRAVLGRKFSEQDTADLNAALNEADGINEMFGDEPIEGAQA